MSSMGEKISKLIKVCSCLYIKDGVLIAIPLVGDRLMYSTRRDNKEPCRLLGNAKGLLRRFIKNSNDPSKAVGIVSCRR
jgi:hypothetical protein